MDPSPTPGESVGLVRLEVDVGRGLRRSEGPPGRGEGGSSREAPRRDVSLQGLGGESREEVG